MPPIIGSVTYQRLPNDFAATLQRLCSDFAWREKIACLSLQFGAARRGQVGVEGVDIGTRVELLRDPMHAVMLMHVLQGPAGLAGSTAVSSSGCACSRSHGLLVTAAQRRL